MKFSAGIRHKKWQIILIPTIAFIFSCLIAQSSGLAFRFPYRLFITLSIFTFIIWEVNIITYNHLDKKLPFYDSPEKRLFLQIVACCIATWITYSFLYFSSYILLTSSLKNISFRDFFFFLLVATGISLVINSLYVIKYLQSVLAFKETISNEKMNDLLQLLDKQQVITARIDNEVEKTISNSMLVETGTKSLNIPFSDMAYWYSSDGLVVLVLTDGKKITTNFQSFTTVAATLPSVIFFQLNRQFITHVQSIISVADDTNRKLIVELSTSSPTSKREQVTVSRYRSQELKRWVQERFQN